ncbi:MAG: glycosyltransferase family 4 protein [Burkholderiales bacterium]
MRVAIVMETWDPAGGGLGQWTAQVVVRLRLRGHDVRIVALRAAPGAPSDVVGLTLLPWHPGRIERGAAVASALAGLETDVVHDLGVGWRYDLIQPQMGSRLASRARESRTRSPWVRWTRRFGPASRAWRREALALESRQYRAGDGLVLAVSRRVADDLVSRHAIAPERVRLVPNGVDVERYAPAPPTADRDALRARLGVAPRVPLVLFAARNARLKGLPALIRAAARLRDRGHDLRIVAIGHPPDRSIRREIERHRAEDRVHCAGPVPDPLPWYRAADAFALPTWYDACSLTVLEACACGLPVVTTRWNGAAELLTDGQDGYVVDGPEDTDALANAIGRAIAPSSRARVGAAARALALRHTLDRNVDAIERAYVEAIERRGAPRRSPTPGSTNGVAGWQGR